MTLPESLPAEAADVTVELVDAAAANASAVVSGLGAILLGQRLCSWSDEATSRAVAGCSPAEAGRSADAIRTWLSTHPELSGAEGLWAQPSYGLEPVDGLTVLSGDTAADQRTLDDWVSEGSRNLIGRFPVAPSEIDALAASVVAARTRWTAPFANRGGRLHRSQAIDLVGTIGEPTSQSPAWAKVAGGTLDVWLAGANSMSGPRSALAAIDAATGRAALVPASALPVGVHGSVAVTEERSTQPGDISRLSLKPFDITSSCDATVPRYAPLVGRALPRLTGKDPVVAGAMEQVARARFDEDGFEAAALTFTRLGRSMAPAAHRRKAATIDFETCVGFAAVDRSTGIVVFAGWHSF